MDDSEVARDLTAVIAEEIEAQLGVHRSVEAMPHLIADAILDARIAKQTWLAQSIAKLDATEQKKLPALTALIKRLGES